MPPVKKKRTKRSYKQRATIIPKVVVAQEESKPVRRVRLKTVSAFTMLFALACLAAFMAGRPPVSAAGSTESRESIQRQMHQPQLRHDDSRRLFGRALGKRKPGAKESEKGAGEQAPIRFLLVNPK